MTSSTRAELFDQIGNDIRSAALAANPALAPLEIEVFFEDELMFASATHRSPEGEVAWRSSHAATPDSTSIPALAEAGQDLVARIGADAALAAAVEGGDNA